MSSISACSVHTPSNPQTFSACMIAAPLIVFSPRSSVISAALERLISISGFYMVCMSLRIYDIRAKYNCGFIDSCACFFTDMMTFWYLHLSPSVLTSSIVYNHTACLMMRVSILMGIPRSLNVVMRSASASAS